MIITILHSSSNFSAVTYNEKKVSAGLAKLMEVQNFDTLLPWEYDAKNLRQYLIDYSARNENIVNAQFHVAISCKGSEYTHEQLLDIAHRYLKEMGYAEEGQPLLVYAHHDTGNNHIHIITSRIAPDGHKINHDHEKRRSRKITERIMAEYEQNQGQGIASSHSTGEGRGEAEKIVGESLSYKYSSKSQFYAILESQGFDCKEDDDKPVVHIYRNGEELGAIQAQLIMQHAAKDSRPDDKRRRQLRAILKKYRDLSANKDELATVMKKKFGISLVFVGRKDNPYGYIVVDHKNKAVYKGGEFLSIRELLQFEDAAIRFAKIEKTIDELLQDNPNLTTLDINLILYRQFGTRIHKGTVSWNGETITLRQSVVDRLHNNYLVSRGIKPSEPVILPPQQSHQTRTCNKSSNSLNPLAAAGGSSDANREHEIGSMDLSVDNEETQRMKWRR